MLKNLFCNRRLVRVHAVRLAGAFAAVAMLAAPSFAVTPIGNFAGGVAETGWGRWDSPDPGFNAGLPQANVSVSNEASTDGDGWSAKIDLDGNAQTLAYNAGTAGTIADFMANNFLVFDVVYGGQAIDQGMGGFNEIWEVIMNSEFGGFAGIGGQCASCQVANPGTSHFVGFGNGDQPPVLIENVTLDYRHIKALWGANTPGWVELIFNIQGDNRPIKYIDNVRLAVPEPSTFAMVGLALVSVLGVARRRK